MLELFELGERVEPGFEGLGLANLAFIRAIRQRAFEGFDSNLLDQWGRLTLEAKSMALFPWYRGELPKEQLETTINSFKQATQDYYNFGETRY